MLCEKISPLRISLNIPLPRYTNANVVWWSRYNQWPSLHALMAKANGKAAAPVEPPRKEIFYGSPDEQRVCYGSAQHTASGGGLCLDQNAIRIGEWKLIVGDGGMPNTWFAPVNASQDEHDQEQSQCVDADETYLHGYNSESPFLPGAGSPTHTAVQVAADEKQHETAWTCSNKASWTEGECRPGELVAVNCLTTTPLI
jgi:hypothetical protein